MANLLLVDDDADILEGLSSTVKWRLIGIKVVGNARNGIEALEFLESNKVDIIITDVRMPGMDGIELAKNVYEKYPEIKIIILSGYSEFEYAKAAMKYGVAEYLLKPVMIKEMLQIVYRLNKEIIANEEKNISLLEELNVIKRNFLLDIMVGKGGDMHEILEGLKKYNIEEFQCSYILINIQFYLTEEQNKLDSINYIIKLLDEKIRIDYDKHYFIQNSKEEFYYIVQVDNNKSNLISLIKQWRKKALENNNIDIKIGVSEILKTFLELEIACNQVKKALKSSFINEDEEIYIYNEKEFEIQEVDNKGILKEISTQIIKSKGQINIEDLDNYFNLLKEYNCINENIIKDISNNILNNIINSCVEKNNNIYLAIYEKYIKTQEIIKNCRSISILYKEMKNFFSYIERIENDNKLDSKNRIVKGMKLYMENNYANELDIKEMSNKFNRSPNYLSHIFSEICGETFSGYLNKIRIDKSKELLKKSDYTIYRISKDIGYSDPKYFIKIFKKDTGYTPTQYRNLASDNTEIY